MKINFDLVPKLKFEEAIKINKKLLYRAQEYSDWNTLDNTVEYLFYDTWDKKKNLLPKPSYKVVLHIHVKDEKKSDGWVKSIINRYEKGEIVNLKTKKKEIINSIEK